MGESERAYERIRAVIDWFETVPAKARARDGSLVGHYVEANDWRAVRSELNQIANSVRHEPGTAPLSAEQPTTAPERHRGDEKAGEGA